jgi:hypothetical protein
MIQNDVVTHPGSKIYGHFEKTSLSERIIDCEGANVIVDIIFICLVKVKGIPIQVDHPPSSLHLPSDFITVLIFLSPRFLTF